MRNIGWRAHYHLRNARRFADSRVGAGLGQTWGLGYALYLCHLPAFCSPSNCGGRRVACRLLLVALGTRRLRNPRCVALCPLKERRRPLSRRSLAVVGCSGTYGGVLRCYSVRLWCSARPLGHLAKHYPSDRCAGADKLSCCPRVTAKYSSTFAGIYVAELLAVTVAVSCQWWPRSEAWIQSTR